MFRSLVDVILLQHMPNIKVSQIHNAWHGNVRSLKNCFGIDYLSSHPFIINVNYRRRMTDSCRYLILLFIGFLGLLPYIIIIVHLRGR